MGNAENTYRPQHGDERPLPEPSCCRWIGHRCTEPAVTTLYASESGTYVPCCRECADAVVAYQQAALRYRLNMVLRMALSAQVPWQRVPTGKGSN